MSEWMMPVAGEGVSAWMTPVVGGGVSEWMMPAKASNKRHVTRESAARGRGGEWMPVGDATHIHSYRASSLVHHLSLAM